MLTATKKSVKTADKFGCAGNKASGSSLKDLVARFSRGNVNLQIGRYASRKEIEERREAVTAFNFDD